MDRMAKMARQQQYCASSAKGKHRAQVRVVQSNFSKKKPAGAGHFEGPHAAYQMFERHAEPQEVHIMGMEAK